VNSSPAEEASDEIAFWRGFIEWWAREKQEPVPPRAWEALACAEEKRSEL
jgi:hypothetical protein